MNFDEGYIGKTTRLDLGRAHAGSLMTRMAASKPWWIRSATMKYPGSQAVIICGIANPHIPEAGCDFVPHMLFPVFAV